MTLTAVALSSVWILFLIHFEHGDAEDICYEKCECSFDRDNDMTSLACTGVPFPTIKKYVQTRARRFRYGRYLKINNSVMPIIDSSTFSNLYIETRLQNIILSNTSIQSISSNAFTIYYLIKLDISYNNLTDINNFIHHQTLQVLNLSFNKIEYLNSSNTFSYLGHLETLYLNNNFLKHINGAFASLSNLRYLYLNNNLLQSLSRNVLKGLISLQYLHLQENPITKIEPESFLDLRRLISLDISGSKIETLQNNTFFGLNSLRQLNLTRVNIKSIVPGAFNTMNSLSVLDLSSNKLEFLQSQSFTGLSNLRQLYLTYNNIQNIIEFSFYGLSSITELHIVDSDNLNWETHNLKHKVITVQNNLELKTNTFQGLNSLHTLTITNLTISNIQTEALRGMGSLQNLNLKNTTIAKIGSKAFSEFGQQTYIVSEFTKYTNHCDNYILHDLHNLSITLIVSNAFNGLAYGSSKGFHLKLSNNAVPVLYPFTFKNVSNLIKLSLDETDIQEIQPLAFDELNFHSNGIYCRKSARYYNTLYLHNNKLTLLKNYTFTGIKNVVEVRLNNNSINSIQPYAFDGLSFHSDTASYNKLFLNNNNLRTLLKDSFVGISNLYALRLDENKIEQIELETFIGLETLKLLKLNSNHLQIMPENLFKNLNYLEVLDLSFNEIVDLYPESFAGLNSLQNLVITNNRIKELPLGTLKNFPLLQSLQLGENDLSVFRTGSFSNLGNLKLFNISSNGFSALNETVLFPLRNLELLYLDRNKFSYINYTSLLMHLSRLNFISVNDNRWECGLLTHMLKTFRERSVDYLFNATSRYTEENVDGIFCTENQSDFNHNDSENNIAKNSSHSKLISTTNSKENLDPLIPLIQNISNILINLELDINSFKQDKMLLPSYDLEKNVSTNSSKSFQNILQSTDSKANVDALIPIIQNISNIFIKSFEGYSHSNTVSILNLVALVCICLLIVIALYKKYYQGKNKKMSTEGAHSKIELLNALT